MCAISWNIIDNIPKNRATILFSNAGMCEAIEQNSSHTLEIYVLFYIHIKVTKNSFQTEIHQYTFE